MKKIIKNWKTHNFNYVYANLKKMEYQYSVDSLSRDFNRISSEDKYCYLIYLLAVEFTPDNVLLICEFLMYTDTFFYDIHPVIRMIMKNAIQLYPSEKTLLNWVVTNYENHPDSPFNKNELKELKQLL